MTIITLETVVGWLRNRGDGLYGGEAVSQLEHALQCATLAQASGATPELVIAASLHDIGHLSDKDDDRGHPHELIAAQLLSGLFPPAVVEPIRLHVSAKRYLCAIDPLYWSGLSEISKRSLEWQGGPFSPEGAASFIAQPYAQDAVALRGWDDLAKTPGAFTLSLDHLIPIMWSLATDVPETA